MLRPGPWVPCNDNVRYSHPAKYCGGVDRNCRIGYGESGVLTSTFVNVPASIPLRLESRICPQSRSGPPRARFQECFRARSTRYPRQYLVEPRSCCLTHDEVRHWQVECLE